MSETEVHEARGVRWRFLDEDVFAPRAQTCVDCERRFVASVHRQKGDDHWCPECEPVESIAHSVNRTLAEAESQPEMVDIEELMDGGNPR